MTNAPSMSFALRGTLPSGGLVQHPLPGPEPSLEEAKARCAGLVALMSSETEWSVVEDAKPEPAKAVTK